MPTVPVCAVQQLMEAHSRRNLDTSSHVCRGMIGPFVLEPVGAGAPSFTFLAALGSFERPISKKQTDGSHCFPSKRVNNSCETLRKWVRESWASVRKDSCKLRGAAPVRHRMDRLQSQTKHANIVGK